MTDIHPDNTAKRAVDACGGVFPHPKNDYDSGWVAGHEAALGAAMDAVGSADRLMEDLIAALDPEALDRAADMFQGANKQREAAEYRAMADRQRALISKAAMQ